MSTKKRTSSVNGRRGAAAPATAPSRSTTTVKTTEKRRRVSRPHKRTDDDDDDDDVDALQDGLDEENERPVRRREQPRRALIDSISHTVDSPPSSSYQLSLPYWLVFVIIEPALLLSSWLLFALNPSLAATVLYSGLISHWRDDAMWSELTLLSLSYFFNVCLILGLLQPMLLTSPQLSRSLLARILSVLLLCDALHVGWTLRFFPDSSSWGLGMWSNVLITLTLAAVRVVWLLQNTDIIAMTARFIHRRWLSIFEE